MKLTASQRFNFRLLDVSAALRSTGKHGLVLSTLALLCQVAAGVVAADAQTNFAGAQTKPDANKLAPNKLYGPRKTISLVPTTQPPPAEILIDSAVNDMAVRAFLKTNRVIVFAEKPASGSGQEASSVSAARPQFYVRANLVSLRTPNTVTLAADIGRIPVLNAITPGMGNLGFSVSGKQTKLVANVQIEVVDAHTGIVICSRDGSGESTGSELTLNGTPRADGSASSDSGAGAANSGNYDPQADQQVYEQPQIRSVPAQKPAFQSGAVKKEKSTRAAADKDGAANLTATSALLPGNDMPPPGNDMPALSQGNTPLQTGNGSGAGQKSFADNGMLGSSNSGSGQQRKGFLLSQFRKTTPGLAIQRALDKAVKSIIGDMFRDEAAMHVVAIEGDIVYVNAGAADGIRLGMRLEVFQIIRIIEDHETHLPIGVIEKSLGLIEVYEADEHTSKAKPVGEAHIRDGDRIRPAK